MIPYGKQTIDEIDIAEVASVLRSELITTGPKASEFEKRFAEYVGAKHAIAVSNGTAALHLALMVSNIKNGDRVVTSPNTFIASANCAAYVGAIPDFVDIDPVSYNLCPHHLENDWKPDTKAVIAVDYAGQTADFPEISRIAKKNGAVVIEDACHAVGGLFEYEGQHWHVGGHPWADMTTFSFHPVKTMTTGEGGMVVTDNHDYAEKIRLLRTHGMIRTSDQFVGLGDSRFNEFGPWYYEMQELGFNFRITDFQCALGLSQLKKLSSFIERRRELVATYNRAFSKHNLIEIPRLRNKADRDLTSWHLYTIQIDFEKAGMTRVELLKQLKQCQIIPQVLYIPVHLQPWYRQNYKYGPGKCPNAEEYYLKALSLPLYPTMSDKDITHVIETMLAVLPE